MKYSSSSLSTVTLGETTIVLVRGANIQHLSLPEGKVVNIDPAISEIVTLGELNTLAISSGIYMIVDSDRFNRVDVLDASFEDLWKFVTSMVVDQETRDQIKKGLETAKARLQAVSAFVGKVAKKLPKDGYVDNLIYHLSKLNLRAAFREIITASKEAYPDQWAKLEKYLSEPVITVVESQIPEHKG